MYRNEWMKILNTHGIKFYSSVMKKNEIMSVSGMWIEVENIILIKATQKSKLQIPSSLWFLIQILKCKHITWCNHRNQEMQTGPFWGEGEL